MKMKPPKMKALPKPAMEKDSKGKEMGVSYDNRPSLSFSETMVPDIKDWSVGKEYQFTVKCIMTEQSIQEHGSEKDKGKQMARFKITHVGVEEKE